MHKFIWRLFSLPFLPACAITPTFSTLESLPHIAKPLRHLLNYIKNTWITSTVWVAIIMEYLQPRHSYKQRFRRLASLIELPYPPKQPALVQAGRCPVPGSRPHAPVDPMACERGQAESPPESQQYHETGEGISYMGLLRPWWPHSDAALKWYFCSVLPSNEDITLNAVPLHSQHPTPTPIPSFPRTYRFLVKVIPPTLHPSFPRTYGFLAKVIPRCCTPPFPMPHSHPLFSLDLRVPG